MAVMHTNRDIDYDDRTGSPEGLPREFIALIIDFPERVYGTWWYVDNYDADVRIGGWYIWIEPLSLLGVSRGANVAWCTVDNFEMGLDEVANRLRGG
jgi:hypothetical protein